jgi:hypothetical protein
VVLTANNAIATAAHPQPFITSSKPSLSSLWEHFSWNTTRPKHMAAIAGVIFMAGRLAHFGKVAAPGLENRDYGRGDPLR